LSEGILVEAALFRIWSVPFGESVRAGAREGILPEAAVFRIWSVHFGASSCGERRAAGDEESLIGDWPDLRRCLLVSMTSELAGRVVFKSASSPAGNVPSESARDMWRLGGDVESALRLKREESRRLKREESPRFKREESPRLKREESPRLQRNELARPGEALCSSRPSDEFRRTSRLSRLFTP